MCILEKVILHCLVFLFKVSFKLDVDDMLFIKAQVYVPHVFILVVDYQGADYQAYGNNKLRDNHGFS